MAARTTLATLISRLRRLVADPAGVGQVWSDDDLQAFLDDLQRRANVDYFELTPAGNFAAGVTINHLIYSAPCGDWEAATLYSQAGAALSPSSADLNQGRWTFASDVPPPVYIVGTCFDIYGAAADVLRARLAASAEEFDFKTDDQEFKRSQKSTGLRATIAQYDARSARWPGGTMSGRGGDVGFGRLVDGNCNPAAHPDRRAPGYFPETVAYRVEHS